MPRVNTSAQDFDRLMRERMFVSWSHSDIAALLNSRRYKPELTAIKNGLQRPIRDFLGRGGKRLRPRIFLALLNAFGLPRKRYLPYALAIECIHNGTLVLDDIQDGSVLRRGKPTIHKAYGIDVAINAGMALHILPMQIIARVCKVPSDIEAHLWRTYADEVARVYFGQSLDVYWHSKPSRTITAQQYIEMARLKTGALFRLPVRFACLLARQPGRIERDLAAFAEDVGVAFQIIDDVLDIVGNVKTFGKSYGNDITEGKMSLPVIYALRSLGLQERSQLLLILKRHTKNKRDIARAINLIEKGGGVTQARKTARRLAHNAHKHVGPYQKKLEKKGLQELLELSSFVLDRTA